MNPISPRARRARMFRCLTGLMLVAASAILVQSPSPAEAAPSRITICHRTHSTTNPYRRITVSVSAVNGSGGNDHSHHAGSPFDPSFAYPPNAKNWGDVIPDAASDGHGSGQNWTTVGQAIFNGTSVGGTSYAGTCGAMSAQQFFNTEVAAGESTSSILADLDDQGAEEDATLLAAIGSFSNPTGSSPSFSTSTTTTTAMSTTSTTAGSGATGGTGSGSSTGTTSTTAGSSGSGGGAGEAPGRVEGHVWIDSDGDSVRDAEELPLAGVTVVLGIASTTTGADGSFLFTNVTSGTYEVVAYTPSTDVVLTWDSDTVVDWHVVVVVTGGTAVADFAARGDGTIVGVVRDQDTAAVVAGAVVTCTWGGIDGTRGTGDDTSLTVYSGADGGFAAENLPHGSYQCVGEDPATGELSKARTVTVAGSTPVTVALSVDESNAAGGGLAFTGRNLTVAMLLGLLVAGSGCWLLVAARLRQDGADSRATR